MFGPTPAYMTSLYFGSTITTAPVITTLGTTTYLMAEEYMKIQKILKQSQFGFGAEIEELKENVEDKIQREVSMKDFMSVLSVESENKTFCDLSNKLFDLDEIETFLSEQL